MWLGLMKLDGKTALQGLFVFDPVRLSAGRVGQQDDEAVADYRS